jgi:hypothetical protein
VEPLLHAIPVSPHSATPTGNEPCSLPDPPLRKPEQCQGHQDSRQRPAPAPAADVWASH